MKKQLAALVCAGLLFAGCAQSPKEVSVEDAPNDFIKEVAALQSDPSATQVLSVFTAMVSNTAQAYNYQLKMDQTTKANSLSVQNEQLVAVPASTHAIDQRIADGDVVYELLEQSSDSQEVAGLMAASKDKTTTVYADYSTGGIGDKNSTITLESVDVIEQNAEYTQQELTDIVQNTVIYPLYPLMGANLIIQPFTEPEYYDFKLEELNGQYTLSISIKDVKAYNQELDTYIYDAYGYTRNDLNGDGSFMVDVYDTSKVNITITMDENGVISKIINENFNSIGNTDNLLDIYTTQTCTLTKVDETYSALIPEIFEKIDNGEYTKGSSIKLP